MKHPLFSGIYGRLAGMWLLLAAVAGGCYPDDFDKETWGPEPELEFSAPGVTLQAGGGTEAVTVTTNYESWTAEVAEAGRSWCEVEQSGDELIIRAAANNQEKERETVVSVTVGKAKQVIKEIAVMQLGTAPRIVADPPAVAFDLAGGSSSVKVTTNVASWTAAVSVGNDWCTAVREGSQLKIKAGAYSGKQMRQALITLSGGNASTGEAVTTVTVMQMGTDPVLSVSAPGAFEPAGGSRALQVITNQATWQATVPGSAAWCKAVPSGNSLMLTVEPNKGEGSRNCEIMVTAGDGSLKQNLMVVQMGSKPDLLLSAAEVSFTGDGGMQTVNVFTDGEWKATTEAAWCALLPGGNTLTLYAGRNPSTTEVRRGTVTVTAGNLTRTLTVEQLPDISLTLSYDTLDIAAEGGTRSVTVVTNQTEWIATVPDSIGWCRVITGENEITVTVDGNTGFPREVVVTITAGTGAGRKSFPLLLRQGGISSDRDVLVAFYQATGGDNWTHRDNWCSDRPLSEWYGVTTEMIPPTKAGEAVERVVGLDMSGDLDDRNQALGNNLVGSIPAVIGRLTELRYLGLFNNQLTGPIPTELGDLLKLETLELESNKLTGTLPETLGKLKKLQFLGVGGNNFDEQQLPAWLWGLTGLRDLRISSANFSGPIPPEIGNLTALQYFYAGNNQFSGPLPSEIGQLIHLRQLLLNKNQLTAPLPESLKNLTELFDLDLGNNRLTGAIPAFLGELQALQYLYLGNNQFTGPVPPELGNLVNLITLGLSNNQLTGAIPPELGNLTKLEKLELAGNQFTGTIPPEVIQLPNWELFDPETNILPQQNGGSLDVTAPGPQDYTVTLQLGGDALEVDQSQAGVHLYGVQVMSRPRGTSGNYRPYGYGIYDDSTQIALPLSDASEYTLNVTLVADGKARVKPDGDAWSLPLDVTAWQTVRGVTPLPDYDGDLPAGGLNVFVLDSLNWLGHIDRGATTLAADGLTYERPDLARYYSQRLNYVPSADEVLTINMARVLFAVSCEVDSLTSGRIRVEIPGAPHLYIDSRDAEHKASGVYTFANTGGQWTNVNYSETLTVKFVWEKPNGLERVLKEEQVEFRRNTATRLHAIFSDDGMSMDIENRPLTDGMIYEIEGMIW